MKTFIQLVIKTREKERYVRSAWGIVCPFVCHVRLCALRAELTELQNVPLRGRCAFISDSAGYHCTHCKLGLRTTFMRKSLHVAGFNNAVRLKTCWPFISSSVFGCQSL